MLFKTKKLKEKLKVYEQELKEKSDKIIELEDKLNNHSRLIELYLLERDMFLKQLARNKFTKIIHNGDATIVWFKDKKVVVKRTSDDKESIYTAVAHAIAKNVYRTNSNFKKEVDSKLIDMNI